jgi:SAM-dependent methyltransferase
MTDSITPPSKVYSKSTAFYVNTKSSFFDTNDNLLSNAEKQNDLYTQQPPRTKCKICAQELSTGSDFTSHHVSYVFCNYCGHLNGKHEDTKSFVESLYIQANGENYAKNYIDTNFAHRTALIYEPKLDFLCASLPAGSELKLLDIGCGVGYFVYAALLRNIDVKGLDVSQTMIEFGNQQISHLQKKNPLNHCAEADFFESIANTDASVVSAIGVIEHLRDPLAFFDAFQQSKAQYLFYSVPMFSLSAMFENVFTNTFPRQLSGGHTHLFTEESISWLHNNRMLRSLSEWRFGTDIMDLYRSMQIEMLKKGASAKLVSFLNQTLGSNIDEIQSIFDKNHFCSEIHCLVTKA